MNLVACRLCNGVGRVWRERRRSPQERQARAVAMNCLPEQTAPTIPVSLTCSMCEGDGFSENRE